MHKLGAVALTISACLAQDGPAAESPAPAKPSIEYGTVDWLRDFDTAQAKANQTAKPMFLLFQEVPG